MFLVMDLSCAYCYFSLWKNSVERGLKADDILAPDKNGRLGGFALFLCYISCSCSKADLNFIDTANPWLNDSAC